MPAISKIMLWIVELCNQLINTLLFVFEKIKNILSDIFPYSESYSHTLKELLISYFPWVIFLLIIRLFVRLVSGARRRKKGIIIVAAIFQMFIPDPYVDRTVKVVQIQTKKESKKESDTIDEIS